MSKTFDLSTLGLADGTYAITVKAIGSKWKDSEPTSELSYTVKTIVPVATPTISLDGTTLNIYDESGIATEFDILVDGVVKETVAVPQGYTITVTGTALYYGNAYATKIKFDTPPASDADNDASMSNSAYVSSPKQLGTFTGKTKAYIWGYGYALNGGSTINTGVSYDSATEVVFDSDSTVNLASSVGVSGGA